MEISDTGSISMATLSSLLGISQRHGARLLKAGVFTAVKLGRYDLAASVQSFVKYRSEGSETGDIASERKRLVRAQAEHEELKVQQRKGELSPVADVESVFAESIVIISSQLDGLAGRLAGELAGTNSPAEVRQKLLEETRRIRRAAADKLEQFIDNTGGENA
ncbi:MAG: hypothetical protein HQL68_03490 [Magnetococcales bacterium]|nr:hypothetical protein [Magnetococcales bacterium]